MTPPPDQGTGEKTEKATPKKREDARKRGQVLKSAEVNTAVTTAAMFGALFLFGGGIISGMTEVLKSVFERMGEVREDVGIADMSSFVGDIVWRFVMILAPILIVAVVVGAVANLMQVGFMFSGESLKPKFSKINPLQGFKRIFSMRSLVEMLKAIIKITVVGVLVYNEYMDYFDSFPGLMDVTVGQAAGEIVSICFSLAFKAILALVGIGLVDYLYQWWEYEKNLKMTKEEVKQEYKQQEGDPQIKGRRREKARQMSMMRMMQSLPKADVVITNPTHYAVALRYNEAEAPAPVVVAKGKDFVAQKIKEKARELGVEIVENKPVAQALYAACDIGHKIPDDMFAAVAEILAYVYKKKNPPPQARRGRLYSGKQPPPTDGTLFRQRG